MYYSQHYFIVERCVERSSEHIAILVIEGVTDG